MDPRQHQAPNHQTGHYQTSYPPQQHGQYSQPPPNTYNDRPPNHYAHSSYPEGSRQHPPSGQSYGGHSPYAGTVSFPEPHRDHGDSASHLQAYSPPFQPTPNSSITTHHQHERRGSHGHPPATGSFSDSQWLYSAGTGSDTGSGSNFYPIQPGVQPHHGGGYLETAADPWDLNPAGHEGAQGHGPWSLSPGSLPVNGHSKHTFGFVSFSGVSSGPI
ncbi:hypothetical protein BGY98DRAFT_68135 [Russula aff. rugulosa BPL654]|nr:hypothetical protein BGY98DRAFT_68135 [Russula aff. rugulosa BPL654]